jgi:DNA-binding transcriptional LysR family regulator
MSSPDLRQLRHFVAVAERLHFGRAAAALNISQPPLSRSIQALEEILGATLLSRSRRHVALTPEGARFLEEAKRILAQLERAAREVGGITELRLGFVSLADYGVLPGLLRAYKAARPGVALSLREMLSPEQAAALTAGDLDFGLLLPPVADAALEHVVVQRERFVAALPSRHRLCRARGKLAARELAGEAFVMTPRAIAPGLHDVVTELAARAGFTPRVAQEAIQMQTVVSLVSSGLGVAIVPASIANLGRRGVVYRELADPHPRLDLWLAWRRGPRGQPVSAAAREFLQHARGVAR